MNSDFIMRTYKKISCFRKTLAVSFSFCMILSMIFALTGCDSNATADENAGTATTASGMFSDSQNNGSISGLQADSTISADSEIITLNADEMFTDRDKETEYDISSATQITLADESVTISKEGCYILSGSLKDGQIIIDADDSAKIQLVLNGVTINSDDSAAIFIKEADKVFITLAEGITNVLTNGGIFSENEYNIDAVIFSKADLTLNGNGTLKITSPAGHGIVSKDDLVITGGIYNITAASSAVSGKDSIRIADGTFTLNAVKDALHSENTDDTSKGFIYVAGGTFDITAESDGLDSSSTIQLEGGTFNIAAGDDAIHADSFLWVRDVMLVVSDCYEGLEAQNIIIDGGTIKVISIDDGINAAGGNDQSSIMAQEDRFRSENSSIIINGGLLSISASGDGIDSNGTLTVNGGEIIVEGPENSGNGALDYNQSAVITGGTLIASGYGGMSQNFGTDSTQCSIMASLQTTQSAGTKAVLTNSSGNVIAEYTPSKSYNSIIISTPDIKTGETYTLTAGTESISIEMTSTIYGSGMDGRGGMGDHGGMGDRGGMAPDDINNRGGRDSQQNGKKFPDEMNENFTGGEIPAFPDGMQKPDAQTH